MVVAIVEVVVVVAGIVVSPEDIGSKCVITSTDITPVFGMRETERLRVTQTQHMFIDRKMVCNSNRSEQ